MRACVAPTAFAVASRARRRATTVATRDGVVVAPVAPVARARADVDRARWARPRRARTHRHRVAVARRAAPADEELARTFVWDAFDVFAAYGALALALGIGGDGALEHFRYGYVPYFAALAMAAIYIGSHRGLTRDFRETISFESSLLGPFVLSAALFAAYVALEILKLDISVAVDFYFFILGTIAVAGNATEPMNALGAWWKEGLVKLRVPDGWATDPKTGETVTDAEFDVTPAQIVGLLAGLALATADLQAGHQNFTLNNAIACFIVSDFLSVIGFGSFKSCATALCGLLAYDAFWVFKSEEVVGKNVMMSVATNQSFNGPFRLLFPRFDDVLNPLPLDAFEFSLLGLGDVAIPGLLVALMLRYDASRATDLRGRANAAADAFMEIFATERDALEAGVENRLDGDGDGDGDFEADGYRSGIGKRAGDAAVLAYDEAGDTSGGTISIPSSLSGRAFFSASLSAYLIGLLVAISANLLTGEGQPALVYLVPVTLGVVAYTAINRGESDRIIEFVDERDSLL